MITSEKTQCSVRSSLLQVCICSQHDAVIALVGAE